MKPILCQSPRVGERGWTGTDSPVAIQCPVMTCLNIAFWCFFQQLCEMGRWHIFLHPEKLEKTSFWAPKRLDKNQNWQ